MTAKDVHAILMAEAIRQSLPTHFKDDLLVHDLNGLIAREKDGHVIPFHWVLRQCGTHLSNNSLHGCAFHESVRHYSYADGVLTLLAVQESAV